MLCLGHISDAVCDQAGRCVQATDDNDPNRTEDNVTVTWAYDALGRPSEWKHFDTNRTGNPLAIGFAYTYDRVGNKKDQRVLHDPRDSQRYAYDSASRLASYVRGDFGPDPAEWCDAPTTAPRTGQTQARRWTLDGVGNWTVTEYSAPHFARIARGAIRAPVAMATGEIKTRHCPVTEGA